MITLNSIHENLCFAIKKSGMKQTEIAKRINVTQSTVAQYISGRALPGLDTFAKLCIVLNVDPGDILGTSQIKKQGTSITNSFNNITSKGNINIEVK